jgi:adrenodoxin-NADP+ reductase
LQSALEKRNRPATVAIIERLPIPYGLVRHGVAPDHPEVKNVQHDFDKLFTHDDNNHKSKSSSTVTIQLYANVQVGTDVSLPELRQLHDVVVLCYGCESDRKLGIPGEHLQGVLSAREFVAWYNGHVDFCSIGTKVKDALSNGNTNGNTNTPMPAATTNIVVVGQGNVALDCARILAKTKESLLDTDIASHALDILDPTPYHPAGDGDGDGDGEQQQQQQPSRIIHVVGRRGHIQGAFTIKVGTNQNKAKQNTSTKHVGWIERTRFWLLIFVCFFFCFALGI